MSKLPSYSSGGAPLSASTARMPSRAATADAARQQLDCSVPQVISVSARSASASPTRNSSLRILLPLSSNPVRSSRLTHSSTPSSADNRSSLIKGVGPNASSTRGIETAVLAMLPTISGTAVEWQGTLRGWRRIRLAEEPSEHKRVADRIVAVVVVERDEDVVGLARQRFDLRQQRLQLRLRVEVVVLFADRGLLAPKLTQPALGVTAVQAQDSRGRGRGHHARDGVHSKGCVHHHVGQPGGLQRSQRFSGVLREPGPVPKLHGQPPSWQPGRQPAQEVERRSPEADPWRELEQHVTQLAGLDQRGQRGAKEAKGFIDRLGRELRGLDLPPSGPAGPDRQQAQNVSGQGLWPGVVAGEERPGLDVKDEARRGALGPAPDGEHIGDG